MDTLSIADTALRATKNLDLNRDFTKMDAVNTLTFVQIFQALDPDIFIDNHVSNGADYPYTLTYISSMKERLAPSMRSLTYDHCIPTLKDYCQIGNFELFPYVELKGETPEEGIVAFNDLPRYAMGYAAAISVVLLLIVYTISKVTFKVLGDKA
jgi:hypothetical protein